MTSETVNEGYKCPICERGRLIEVRPKVWHCARQRCNNEFFHDADGTLNVRDKAVACRLFHFWQPYEAPTIVKAESVEGGTLAQRRFCGRCHAVDYRRVMIHN